MADVSADQGNPKDASSLWATIGKVGVVVGLFYSGFQLEEKINPDKARLAGKCHIQNSMPDSPITRAEKAKREKDAQAKATKGGQSVVTTAFVTFLGGPLMVQCEVFNSGKQEAKDIVLDLPFEPNSVDVDGEAVHPAGIKGRAVNVGAIRPQKLVVIRMWGDGVNSWPTNNGSYTISHSAGVGKLSFPVQVYGVAASIATFTDATLSNPILFFLLILIPILIVVYLYLEVRIRKNMQRQLELMGTAQKQEESRKSAKLVNPSSGDDSGE